MISFDVNIDQTTVDGGDTALILSASKGHAHVAQLLLVARARIEAGLLSNAFQQGRKAEQFCLSLALSFALTLDTHTHTHTHTHTLT